MSVSPTPSTSSAVCRACFLARRAQAPRLAAYHWSGGWATLAARLAEASRSLTACCCLVGWAALATQLPWQHAWQKHPVPWLLVAIQRTRLPWQRAWRQHSFAWLLAAV